MAPKTKTFKNCIIAYTDDIPLATRDKIKGWVGHAGGSISKEITDNVTHLILTGRDWRNYKYRPKVKEARSRKTIYLMRISWLEDSLTLNKSKNKPLDECDKRYTWEIKHARKVIKHREIKKAEKKKKAFVARMVAAKQEREQSEEGDVGDNQVDETPADCGVHQQDVPCEDLQDGDVSATKSTKADLHIKDGLKRKKNQGGVKKEKVFNKNIIDAERRQQVFECGIKFDKAILETERNMALAGYRPYIDPNGIVHMIMLVRDDIHQVLQEQYRLKRSISPASFCYKRRLPTRLDGNSTTEAATHRQSRGRVQRKGGFDAGEDTRLRYFEDPVYCNKSSAQCHTNMSIDKLNDGQYTPVAISGTQFDSRCLVRKWVNDLAQQPSVWTESHQPAQRNPFSSLPFMPYTPVSTVYPQIRVRLPQPFAYTLQLYESIDQPRSSCERIRRSAVSTTESKPPSSNAEPSSLASFTQFLPQDSLQYLPSHEIRSIQPHVLVDSVSTPPPNSTHVYPPQKRTYMLVCQYTRKGKSKVSEYTTLAPEGSSFEFAMDMFRKVFRKKTGLNWDEVKGRHESGGIDPGAQSDSDRDSGIGLDGVRSLETGIILSEELSRQNSDNLSVSSGTIQGDEPVNITTKPASSSAEAIQPTNADIVSPSFDKIEASEDNERAASTSAWTLSSSKDVGRAGYRSFTYIPTERKIFEDGNEKYKAQYDEDLFLFPEDQPATMVKGNTDATNRRSDRGR